MNQHKFLHGFVIFVMLLSSLAISPAAGQKPEALGTVYVDVDATGANDGTSWENAYTDLQPALEAAVSGDEIWVAAGTYYPSVEHCGSGDPRYQSFQMKNGVTIYGGFDPTAGDDTWDERDWVENVITLSGDIGISGDNSDNSYHVFCHPDGLNLDSSAALDGFTVQEGNANLYDFPDGMGGGMFNYYSSPALANVIFTGHTASLGGGGMFNEYSSPALINTTFSNNPGGGMWNRHSSPTITTAIFSNNSASGMYNQLYSSPVLTHVTFSNNHSGGMINSYSSPTLVDVQFIDNVGYDEGGGMYNGHSSPNLSNVTFSGNSAAINGGGMVNKNSSSPNLINVTFSGNSAQYGGGMYNSSSSSPYLVNVTFSGGSCQLGCGMYNDSSSPILTNVKFVSNGYLLMGSGGGMANISSSPILTNVIFSNNEAMGVGGMLNNSSSPILTNVTFSNNLAGENGTGGIAKIQYSTPIVTNCILWGDTPEEIYNDPTSFPIITYSDIWIAGGGIYPGTGNVNIDPLFIDAANGNPRLQDTSPVIDAGNNEAPGLVGIITDLDGSWRFVDIPSIPDTGFGTPPIVDMGAYENYGNLNTKVYLPLLFR